MNAEEHGFIKSILTVPEEMSNRLVYADWLDENDQPEKAEYLRLTVKFHQEILTDPEVFAEMKPVMDELIEIKSERNKTFDTLRKKYPKCFERNTEDSRNYNEKFFEIIRTEDYELDNIRIAELEAKISKFNKNNDTKKFANTETRHKLQQLAAKMDTNWLAVVGDTIVEGCGGSTGNKRVRFDFVCPLTWANMEATDDNKVRVCSVCKEKIHYCDNIGTAREEAYRGECIAVDLGIIRDYKPEEGWQNPKDLDGKYAIFGNPSIQTQRENWREEMDEVSRARTKNKTLDEK